jgi:hypothetical protein
MIVGSGRSADVAEAQATPRERTRKSRMNRRRTQAGDARGGA